MTDNERDDLLWQINGNVERVGERQEELAKEVKQHALVLDGPPGNGDRPGLRSRMTLSEKAIDVLDGQRKSQQRRLWAVVVAALAAGFGAVASAIVGG